MVSFKRFLTFAVLAISLVSAVAAGSDEDNSRDRRDRARAPGLISGTKQAWRDDMGPVGATAFVGAKVVTAPWRAAKWVAGGVVAGGRGVKRVVKKVAKGIWHFPSKAAQKVKDVWCNARDGADLQLHPGRDWSHCDRQGDRYHNIGRRPSGRYNDNRDGDDRDYRDDE